MTPPYNLRLDIPARATITAQILNSAEQAHALDKFKADVLDSLSLSQVERQRYTVLDQSYLASALYCLLVVPREILNLPNEDRLFTELNRADVAGLFKIVLEPPELKSSPAYYVLWLLRNSIAHALFEIDCNNNWEFYTKQGMIWRAAIRRDSLVKFISVVGDYLARRCLELKTVS